MFAHFGHKWVALHRGPCWQYEEKNDKGHKITGIAPTNIIEDALQLSGISLDEEEPIVCNKVMMLLSACCYLIYCMSLTDCCQSIYLCKYYCIIFHFL